jgi:hypothetical protein
MIIQHTMYIITYLYHKLKKITYFVYSYFNPITLILTPNNINNIIDLDKRYRKLNLEWNEDLINYDMLYYNKLRTHTQIHNPFIQSIKINKPHDKTLKRMYKKTHNTKYSSYEIINQLNKIPIISDFTNEEWKHINICGGLITKLTNYRLLDKYIAVDIDIFITNFETFNEYEQFIIELHNKYFRRNKNIMIVIKSNNALTYQYVDKSNPAKSVAISFQIILRCYSNISQILHGFDLGSCSIGYNGHDIYLTSLGYHSFLYGVNLIDGTHRSTTYEKRLIKYLKRGFRIVLSEYDKPFTPALDFKYIKFETNIYVDDYEYNVFAQQCIIKHNSIIETRKNENDKPYPISSIDTKLLFNIINNDTDNLMLFDNRIDYMNNNDKDNNNTNNIRDEINIPECITNTIFCKFQHDIKELMLYLLVNNELLDIHFALFDEYAISNFIMHSSGFQHMNETTFKTIYTQTIHQLAKKTRVFNTTYKKLLQLNFNYTSPMTQECNLLTNSFNPSLISTNEWY